MKVNKNNNDINHQSNKQENKSFKSKESQKAEDISALTCFKSRIVSSSSISMNQNTMTGVVDPKVDGDPINFRYLKENYVSKSSLPNNRSTTFRFLPISGSMMFGDINMGKNEITDLPTPTTSSSSDTAATVGYVKDRADQVAVDPNVIEKIKELKEVSKNLDIIEDVLGVKPTDPNNPSVEEEDEIESSKFVQHKGSCMTGCLHMKHHDLTGIPTPLDTDADHAASVEYVQIKKRSLEVIVGEEEENNNNGGELGGGSGGGSGDSSGGSGGGVGESAGGEGWGESYYEDGSGNVVFHLSRGNINVGGIGYNDSILWADWNYHPTFEEMNDVIRLNKATSGERYKMAEILVRGKLDYNFTFRINEGKGRMTLFDNSMYTNRDINFQTNPNISGSRTLNGRKNNPSSINIMNLTPYEENKPLYGTWDWSLTLTVTRGDLDSDWPGFTRVRS